MILSFVIPVPAVNPPPDIVFGQAGSALVIPNGPGSNRAIRIGNYSPFVFMIKGVHDSQHSTYIISPYTMNVYGYSNVRGNVTLEASSLATDVTTFPPNMHISVEWSEDSSDFRGVYPANLGGTALMTINQGQHVPGAPAPTPVPISAPSPIPVIVTGGGGVTSIESVLVWTTGPEAFPNGNSHAFGLQTITAPAAASTDPSGRYLVVVESTMRGHFTTATFNQGLFSGSIQLGGTNNDGIYFDQGGYLWTTPLPPDNAGFDIRARAIASCNPGATVSMVMQGACGTFPTGNSDSISIFMTSYAQILNTVFTII